MLALSAMALVCLLGSHLASSHRHSPSKLLQLPCGQGRSRPRGGRSHFRSVDVGGSGSDGGGW